MKKLVKLFAISMAVVAFAACNGNAANNDSQNADTNATNEPEVVDQMLDTVAPVDTTAVVENTTPAPVAKKPAKPAAKKAEPVNDNKKPTTETQKQNTKSGVLPLADKAGAKK